MKTIGDLPIRKKLMLFFIMLFIVPLCIFSIVVTFVMRSALYSQTQRRSEQYLQQSMQGVENSLSELDSIMMSNLRNQDMQRVLNQVQTNISSPEEKNIVRKQLRNIAYTRRDIVCLVIITNSGERFVFPEDDVYREVKTYISRKVPDWEGEYASIFRRGETIWKGLPETPQYIMGVRRIRNFETLQELGCLYIFFEERTIRQQYENLKMTPGSFFIIEDLEGETISCDGTGTEQGTAGLKEKNLYSNRLDNPELGWTIWGYVPTEEMLYEIHRVQLVFFSIICLLLGILILLMRKFSASITDPIRNLQEKMLEIRSGNFDVVAEVEHKDEVGELAETFNTMASQVKELIEKDYQSRLLVQETEYKFLRAQINPHLLYNTLDSISWMSAMGNGKEASQMSVALGRILRWSISNTKHVVRLQEEAGIVKDYLFIQRLRYGESLVCRFDWDEPELSFYVPKMILQPLVENALQHGLNEKDGEKRVIIGASTVKTDQEEQILEIRVCDNGVGIAPERIEDIIHGRGSQEKNHGVGMYNVHHRIQLRYGKEYGLYIESALGEGTCIYIRLPIRREETDEGSCNGSGR